MVKRTTQSSTMKHM